MNTTNIALSAAALLLAAGCAGNQSVPTASMSEAQQKMEEAERAQAQRYATQELSMARESLDEARRAQEEGDEERAARLTERAAIDADYATAVARNEQLQDAVQELRDTLATLESEIERGQTGAPDARF
jgi:chromosome segregation ATPase